MLHNNCNLNVEEHLKYVDTLIRAGIIDETMGKSIKQNMIAEFTAQKAAQSALGAQIMPQSQAPQAPTYDIAESEFLRARECLLNYLKGQDLNLSRADLKDIEAVVLELEKGAIQRQLSDSNELAKERLITGALTGSGVKTPVNRTFTRDEIAKMSTAEFIKNEPAINYQLQNGLL